MTNVINNGQRVAVAFPFFNGEGGMSRREGSAEATIAIRDRARGAQPGPGTVDGQAVEAVRIQPSPTVEGMTLIDVRFAGEDA